MRDLILTKLTSPKVAWKTAEVVDAAAAAVAAVGIAAHHAMTAIAEATSRELQRDLVDGCADY